jgi:DNA (cytosine-5)-methyltransferase 1
VSDTIRGVDLFAGGGGCSTGFAEACEDRPGQVDLAAINHWKPAIRTHEQNHPWADHYHAGVEQVNPIEVFPDGDIDLLIAAPECTDFSKARGGTPVEPQDRMKPFHVLDWVAQLRPQSVLIENVPGFKKFGPIVDGRATRNGQFFQAWLHTLQADPPKGLGYNVSTRELVAADYGDPTTRKRLFVIARRDDDPVWPAPTHSDDPDDDLADWQPASEAIDFTERGQSIWTRGLAGNGKTPLAQTTMGRIAQGLRRYGPDRFEPFADVIEDLSASDVEALQHDAVPVAELPDALETRSDPFLARGPVAATDGGTPVDGDDGACPPYVRGQHGGSVPRDATEDPVQTVTTDGAIQVIEPTALVLPRLQIQRGDDSNPAYDPDVRPLHTVTAKNHDGHVVTPYLRIYNGNSGTRPASEPLPSQPATDRFGLVVPELYPWGLDIEYRMLQPRELARAQGFPEDYGFVGDTKATVTEQIGNAVPVNLARALCSSLLDQGSPTLETFVGEGDPAAETNGGEQR